MCLQVFVSVMLLHVVDHLLYVLLLCHRAYQKHIAGIGHHIAGQTGAYHELVRIHGKDISRRIVSLDMTALRQLTRSTYTLGAFSITA